MWVWCVRLRWLGVSQTGKPEAAEDESGKQSSASRLFCLVTRVHNALIVSLCDQLKSMMYDVSGLKCLLTSRDDLIMSAVSNDMILKAVNKSRYVEDWYADTGTAFHMTDSLACMKDLKPCHKSVNGIGGVSCEVAFSGTLELVFVTADSEFSVELKNVLYSPNLGYNLFSPSAEFDGESWNGLGGPDGVMTAFNGQVTFQNFDGMLIASAYRLGEASVGTVLAALTPSNPKHETKMDVNEFHNIYAHSHEGLLRTTAKRLGTELVGDMHACTGCSMSKAIRKGIVRETKNRSDKKLGRVFVDLGGRKDIASVGGKHYPMIVKDDFTRRAWMYFLKNKSDAGSAFRSFLASVRADGVPSLVEIVRSDNGGEFFGGEFASVCNELLIKQEFTPAYSPQYNGVAERGLGLIEEAAMAARIQAKVLFGHVQLPKTDKLWAEAMHWACEAMNHTACSANPDSKSPYEMWYGEPRPARPYPFLKPAYCRWQRPSKLLPKGESCFYVGPSRDHPRDCHRVLTRAGTIQETRDVTWEVLPSQLPPLQPSLPIEVAEEGGEDSDDVEDEVWPLVGRGVAHTLLKRDAVPSGAGVVEVESVGAGSVGPSPSVPSSPSEPSSPVNNSSDSVDPSVSSPVPEIDGERDSGEIETGNPGGDDEVEQMGQGGQDDEELIGSGGPVEAEAPPPTGRRPRHVAELADFNTAARENDEVRDGRTRAQTRAVNQQSVPGLMATLGPISATEVVYALLSEQRAGDETELPKELVQDVESEPGSYQEAQRSKYAKIWEGARSAEVEGLIRAGTFTLAVKVPIGCNVIDARWVFKWKADETGKIVKAKARLVAKGFKQKYGVDYLETFSPTANAASHRLVVALACKYNLELLHWDIEQAFVQSELDHEVFMKLPPGCGSMSGKVVRLNKSLYGLKQASRTFYKRLVSELKRIGFEQSMSDPCVLRFMMGDEVVGMVAIHVDDILYAGTKSLAEVVVAALGDSLPTKNLGEVKFFLGCEYIRDRKAGTIEISQESYIRSVLERFNICRTSSIPASLDSNDRSLKEDEGAGDVPFREVVGSLMWIASQTRADISNAVRAVARHSHEPKKSHWKAAQKILNYLLETAHLTLKFKRDSSVDVGILVYVDADFASKATDRRSVSGAMVFVAAMLVVWISRTQKCVSQSTSEAEYLAMGDGVKEALFVNGMLQFLRPSAKPRKIDVLEDNEGAIALAENPMSSCRSKHIDVRHHFLRNLTEEGVIEVTHVPSKEQHADILTKALPRDLFEVHRDFALGSRK